MYFALVGNKDNDGKEYKPTGQLDIDYVIDNVSGINVGGIKAYFLLAASSHVALNVRVGSFTTGNGYIKMGTGQQIYDALNWAI